jgi:hypothetical protein
LRPGPSCRRMALPCLVLRPASSPLRP